MFQTRSRYSAWPQLDLVLVLLLYFESTWNILIVLLPTNFQHDQQCHVRPASSVVSNTVIIDVFPTRSNAMVIMIVMMDPMKLIALQVREKEKRETLNWHKPLYKLVKVTIVFKYVHNLNFDSPCINTPCIVHLHKTADSFLISTTYDNWYSENDVNILYSDDPSF